MLYIKYLSFTLHTNKKCNIFTFTFYSYSENDNNKIEKHVIFPAFVSLFNNFFFRFLIKEVRCSTEKQCHLKVGSMTLYF